MPEVGTRVSEPRQTMMQPVLARLSSVDPCTPDLERRILALGPRVEMVAAKTVLQAEDAPVRRPRYLISGWGLPISPPVGWTAADLRSRAAWRRV